MRITYEKPTDFTDLEPRLAGGMVLPVVNGPFDGELLQVPALFGALFPAFVRLGGWHVYQLDAWARFGVRRLAWRYAHTIGKDWVAASKVQRELESVK